MGNPIKIISVVMALVFSQDAIATQDAQRKLEASAQDGLAIDPSYEMKAMPAYFGTGDVMRRCAPPNAPVAAPFTLYISVSSSGQIEGQSAFPATDVAQCIIAGSSSRRLPAPKAALVLKIDMRFTE